MSLWQQAVAPLVRAKLVYRILLNVAMSETAAAKVANAEERPTEGPRLLVREGRRLLLRADCSEKHQSIHMLLRVSSATRWQMP